MVGLPSLVAAGAKALKGAISRARRRNKDQHIRSEAGYAATVIIHSPVIYLECLS